MPVSELAVFFKEFLTTFQTTGAIAPSSRYLAREICRQVAEERRREPHQRLRLLEVGPGTGVFTGELCRHLRAGDHLDVVELNERFVDVVRRKLGKFNVAAGATVKVIHASVGDHRPTETYDHIVSGLPLNNFPPALVRELLAHMLNLLKPAGTLSYFEYIALPRIKRALLSGPDVRRMTRVCALTRKIRRSHGVRQEAVWRNVPPAWVHVLKATERGNAG